MTDMLSTTPRLAGFVAGGRSSLEVKIPKITTLRFPSLFLVRPSNPHTRIRSHGVRSDLTMWSVGWLGY